MKLIARRTKYLVIVILLIILFLNACASDGVSSTTLQGPFETDALHGLAFRIFINAPETFISSNFVKITLYIHPIILDESIHNITIKSIRPYLYYSDLALNIHEIKLWSTTDYLKKLIDVPTQSDEAICIQTKVFIPDFNAHEVVGLGFKIAVRFLTDDAEIFGYLSLENVGIFNVIPEPIFLRDSSLSNILIIVSFLVSLLGLVYVSKNDNIAYIKEILMLLLIFFFSNFISIQLGSIQMSYVDKTNTFSLDYETQAIDLNLGQAFNLTIFLMLPEKSATPEWFPIKVHSVVESLGFSNISAIQIHYIFSVFLENESETPCFNKSVFQFILLPKDLESNSTLYSFAISNPVIFVCVSSIKIRIWFTSGEFIEFNIKNSVIGKKYAIIIEDAIGNYYFALASAIGLIVFLALGTFTFVLRRKSIIREFNNLFF